MLKEKFGKLGIATALLFAGAMAMSGPADATPYVGSLNTGATNDGVLTGISGIDMYSLGSGAFFNLTTGGNQVNPAVPGEVSPGDIVQTYYQGIVSVVSPGVPTPNLLYPGSSGGDTYQLTVAASFQEIVTAVVGNTAILQPLTGGRVSLFYDTGGLVGGNTPANISAGTGFTDGILLLDGSVTAYGSSSTQTLTPPTSNGFATVVGPLSYAKLGSAPPDPDVVGWIPNGPGGFDSSTTIQFGCPDCAGAQTSSFFDNANGWTTVAGVTSAYTLKTDANVSFTVPEPGSLALLGLGLAGLGFAMRRRSSMATA